jgi:hypothetical protein
VVSVEYGFPVAICSQSSGRKAFERRVHCFRHGVVGREWRYSVAVFESRVAQQNRHAAEPRIDERTWFGHESLVGGRDAWDEDAGLSRI